MISLIWAEEKNGGIGFQGKLPWNLPADLRHFKDVTSGHPIIMGRKTLESFPRLLPGRMHLVLTKSKELKEKYKDNDKVLIFEEIATLKNYINSNEDDYFIIGGAKIYEAFVNDADILERTKIDHLFDVDVWMPEIPYNKFELVKEQQNFKDDKNKYNFKFLTYKKAACD